MKKFNRQVPSEQLQDEIRHNIKTNFVFEEKPAPNLKKSVMKKIIFASGGLFAGIVATLFIISLLPVGMDSFNPSHDSSDKIELEQKVNPVLRNVKIQENKEITANFKKANKKSLNSQKFACVRSKRKIHSKPQNIVDRKMVCLNEAICDFDGPILRENRSGLIPSMPIIKPRKEEEFNTEDYDRIYDNEFKTAANTPLSTFSIDVDSASYANLRRFLNSNTLPPKDAVRIEEMINYFTYDYPQPKGNAPFSIITEVSKCPWNKENNLVMIGLQGKKIKIDKLPPNNLVFLLDVSGSMSSPNKLPLLKSAFKLLTKQLRSEDRVSIVVYAGAAGLVLDSTSGNQKEKILSAIEKLNAGGSTAGGAGIKLAYKIAKENLISNGNNRIIIATDGDFNIGQSSDSALVRMIEEKRNDGIFLTVLGFGMGNYKDNKMEKLADKGNGNYAYIDDIMEAKKVLVNELGATLFTIAKDVKLQIEFNPAEVKAYRLIGYENRILAKEDFNDDKKDAGELGAGHSVTAFYEIVPADSTQTFAKVDDLKYQKTKINKSKELLTVKLRYKKPKENKSRLITKIVKKDDVRNKMSENCSFASAVAEFGMLLRDSKYKGNASLKTVLHRARNSKGKDYDGYRAEFIRLVERAELIDPSLGKSSKTINSPVLRGSVSLAGKTSGIDAKVWAEDINNKLHEPIYKTTIETKSGGFLTGKLISESGEIITNVKATYDVYGGNGNLKSGDKIPINIEKDGTYTTPNLPIGKCDIRFSAPGFLEARVETYLKNGETIIKDAIFKSYEKNLCVVRDSITKERVSNVEIICISPTNINSKPLDSFTDADGEFRVLLGMEDLYLEFRHPDYATIRNYFQSRNTPRKKTVEISKGGNVLIKVIDENNEPIPDSKVKLVANYRWRRPYNAEFNNLFIGKSDDLGETLFENVPSHLPFIIADVTDCSNVLTRSKRFKIKPGITTTVMVSKVDAKLIVRFSEPVLGKSIRVELSAPNGWFQYNDFFKTSNEWILPGVIKGNYKIFIRGGDIQNIETNIFIEGKVDTILKINNSNTNATGVIKGIIHTPSGEKLSAYVHAWKHGKMPKNKQKLHYGDECASYAYPKHGDFVIDKLNLKGIYDIRIEIAGLTNIFCYSVVPNCEPLDIVTPPAYRVTGSLVNSDGDPIKGMIWISSFLFGQHNTSDFELYPVFPGNYTIKIITENHPLLKRNVTISSSDVDLGEIVIDDEGIVISGRLLDSKGKPIIDKRIRMYGPPNMSVIGETQNDMHSDKSNDDGRFEVRNLPSDEIISLHLFDDHFSRNIGPFSIDTDIGDVIIKSPPFTILTVLKADGSPASGLYVNRKKLDENGHFQGQLDENSDSVTIHKTKPGAFKGESNMYTVDIPITDSLTNQVTITLPENFYNK